MAVNAITLVLSAKDHHFSPSSFFHYHQSKQLLLLQHKPIFLMSIFFFLTLVSLLSLSSIFLSIYTRKRKCLHLLAAEDKTNKTQQEESTQLTTHSLLVEILPSNSPKWAALFNCNSADDPVPDEEAGLGRNSDSRPESEEEECEKKKKKKKKRAKKKKGCPNSPPPALDSKAQEEEGRGTAKKKENSELVCLYPFTSSSSATQRKIKQHYDQLVKSNNSNGLTLAQVGQFVTCLIEARNELQLKSEAIQRKFTVKRALLFKADRSSFDRFCQQIYKLELEQKRLEEDAFVYNWLQQQLKLSPAYKKMLDISACMELKTKSDKPVESSNTGFDDITFEEFLAQEKKDSYWQRNRKPRTCSGC